MYFLVVWLGAFFSTTQTTTIFGDQDITKYSYNLFLVVERTDRISLASFSGLQCHAHDLSFCLMLKYLHDQMISKCLYNLFLVVKRTGRISLADFSDLQCHPRAVPLGCCRKIPSINSPHKCTVFVQFSA